MVSYQLSKRKWCNSLSEGASDTGAWRVSVRCLWLWQCKGTPVCSFNQVHTMWWRGCSCYRSMLVSDQSCGQVDQTGWTWRCWSFDTCTLFNWWGNWRYQSSWPILCTQLRLQQRRIEGWWRSITVGQVHETDRNANKSSFLSGPPIRLHRAQSSTCWLHWELHKWVDQINRRCNRLLVPERCRHEIEQVGWAAQGMNESWSQYLHTTDILKNRA